MAAFSSWRRCLGCFPSWKSSSLTAAIKDRNSPTRWQKFFRISTLKSSGDPTPQSASRSYLNAGSSNAPSLGSIAAGGSPRIGRTSIARRSHSCASLQFASCSENSVIRPKVSGQTLRGTTLGLPEFAYEEKTPHAPTRQQGHHHLRGHRLDPHPDDVGCAAGHARRDR